MKLPAWKKYIVFNLGDGCNVEVEAVSPEHALLVAVTGTSSQECPVVCGLHGTLGCGDYAIQSTQKGSAI